MSDARDRRSARYPLAPRAAVIGSGFGGLAAIELDAAGGVSPYLQNGALAAAAQLGARDDGLSRSGGEKLAHKLWI